MVVGVSVRVVVRVAVRFIGVLRMVAVRQCGGAGDHIDGNGLVAGVRE